MAKKPRDPVQFTYESAERIANVVRAAETSPAVGSPLRFNRQLPVHMARQVRAARFTGSWPIGGNKTVTFKNAPTVTASVTNLSWPISSSGYVNEDCLVGKDGTSWYLVCPVLESATAIVITGTTNREVVTGISTAASTISYISDVSATASLNTSSCSITVGLTKTLGSLKALTGITATTATHALPTSTATTIILKVRVP